MKRMRWLSSDSPVCLSLSSDSTLDSFQDQMETQSQEVKKLFEEYNKMVHTFFFLSCHSEGEKCEIYFKCQKMCMNYLC